MTRAASPPWPWPPEMEAAVGEEEAGWRLRDESGESVI